MVRMLQSIPGWRSRRIASCRPLATFFVGLLALSITCAHAAPERAHEIYNFDIERTTRVTALNLLGKQADGLVVGYLSSNSAEELALVGPVKGPHTIEDAVRVIVKDSMLTFRWVDDTMASVESIWVSGLDTVVPEPIPWIDSMTVTEFEIPSALQTNPTIAFDREFIDQTGAPTLGELIRELLQQPVRRGQTNGSENIDFRGVGSRYTKVLIDGRPIWPAAGSLASDAFDLHSVPLAAIQRIEVLPAGASAAYGIDAASGVLNVVLRRQVGAPTVEIFHSSTAGGGDRGQAVASASFQGPNSNGIATLEYLNSENLLGSERDLWSNQDYRRFGGLDYRSLNVTPNISSWSGEPLPGLGTQYAAVSRFGGGLRPGERELGNRYLYRSITPEETRVNAVALGETALNSGTRLRGDFLYATHDSIEQFAPAAIAGQVVSASNPYNPLGVPVVANAALFGLGPQRQHFNVDRARAAAVLMGQMHEWKWELSFVQSYESTREWMENAADFQRISQALAESDATRALNVFVPHPARDPPIKSELLTDDDLLQYQRSHGKEVGALMRGALLTTSAGKVSLMVGGSRRAEKIEIDSGQVLKRDITSSFAELHIPLIGRSQRVPLMQDLSVRAALRSDNYDDEGRFSLPQFGVTWTPDPAVSLQATYGKTALPTAVWTASELAVPAEAIDPLRDNELASFLTYRSSTTPLAPTTGESFNANIEFTLTNNVALVLSYWQISLEHRSALLSLHHALTQDGTQTRIQRYAPTPADVAAGRPGPIRSVDLSPVDLGKLEASGIDIGISRKFDTPLGRFTPRLDATWVSTFETEEGGASSDRAGIASEYGSICRWEGRLGTIWEAGPVMTSLVLKHLPACHDAYAGIPSRIDVPAVSLLNLHVMVDLDRMGFNQLRIGMGATDVFDEGAPYAHVGGVKGFDDGQSNLQGREFFIRLRQQF